MLKKKGNKFTKESEQIIIDCYNKHLNLSLVMDELKLHKTTLRRVLNRNGISTNRNKVGSEHPMWKGGRINCKGGGYIGIWKPDHPRADNGNYVYEHTLIYEQNTGELPKKNEMIHHIDLDKHNNNFDNLYLCDASKHLQLHRNIEKLVSELMKKGQIGFKDGDYYII